MDLAGDKWHAQARMNANPVDWSSRMPLWSNGFQSAWREDGFDFADLTAIALESEVIGLPCLSEDGEGADGSSEPVTLSTGSWSSEAVAGLPFVSDVQQASVGQAVEPSPVSTCASLPLWEDKIYVQQAPTNHQYLLQHRQELPQHVGHEAHYCYQSGLTEHELHRQQGYQEQPPQLQPRKVHGVDLWRARVNLSMDLEAGKAMLFYNGCDGHWENDLHSLIDAFHDCARLTASLCVVFVVVVQAASVPRLCLSAELVKLLDEEVRQLKMPVVGFAEGRICGMSMALLLACDQVISCRDTTFLTRNGEQLLTSEEAMILGFVGHRVEGSGGPRVKECQDLGRRLASCSRGRLPGVKAAMREIRDCLRASEAFEDAFGTGSGPQPLSKGYSGHPGAPYQKKTQHQLPLNPQPTAHPQQFWPASQPAQRLAPQRPPQKDQSQQDESYPLSFGGVGEHPEGPSPGDTGSAGGEGVETTSYMICHIPCRISRKQLAAAVDSLGFAGKYHSIYTPRARGGSSPSLGYAFINLLSAKDGPAFIRAMTGYHFEGACSTKRCAVQPARIQSAADAAYLPTSCSRRNCWSPPLGATVSC